MARGKGRSGRRYVRDNRGRFASKGAGATARGGRLKTAGGNKRATQTMKASGAKAAGTISKPKGLKPGAIKAKPKALKANTKALPAAKPAAAAKPARRRAAKNAERKASRRAGKAARPQASKVDTSISAIARRRQRAMADRSSIAGGQFNMKLSTRSAITRSAANEIYNRQRQIAKASGGRIDPAVARNATGVLRGISGTKRQRAEQLRERARRRVVSGRRR